MSKKKSKNRLTPQERKKKDITGVVLTSVSAILFFALITKGHEGYVGSLGSVISGNLHAFLGSISYLIPLIGFWWAAAEFRYLKISLGYSMAAGGALFVIGGSVLFHLIAGQGGELGGFTAEVILKSALGPLGAYIAASTSVAVALILITDISPRRAAAYAARFLKDTARRGAEASSEALKKTCKKKPRITVSSDPSPVKEKKSRRRNASAPKKAVEDNPSDPDPESSSQLNAEQCVTEGLPPSELLYEPKSRSVDTAGEETRGGQLVDVLKNFAINASISGIQVGPSITRYELSLPMDVQLSRVRNLSSNIAMATQAKTVRLLTPIPGKSAVGVEVPALNQETVPLRSLIESEDFSRAETQVPYCLGKAVSGELKIADLSAMPHLLLAGATGSGKSVAIHTLINSILYKSTPEEVSFVMMDPKRVELPVYNGIPHLVSDVITNPSVAVKTLSSIASEMDARYDKLAAQGVASLSDYNSVPGIEKLPRIVVIIDELADLMVMAKDRVESAIIRIAQMARAVGIHLVLATQRPSVDVITGIIKANLPARIAFSVLSGVDSRTILDVSGAEKLLGKGDMLYQSPDLPQPERIQGCYITRKEVQKVVGWLTGAYGDYEVNVHLKTEDETSPGSRSAQKDELYTEALKLVIKRKKASISLLQRRLGIGYNRAAKIIDAMETENVIGPDEGGVRGRRVLVAEDYLEKIS